MARYQHDEWEGDSYEPGYDPGPSPCEDCPRMTTCRSIGDCEGFEVAESSPAFADPGGRSALRAASESNPRNLPCPTCGAENVLTAADRARGYQCDRCADQAERGGW